MQLAPIERLCLEGDDCRVARLGAVDIDLSSQFHPGHSEDRAGISTGQTEGVFLTVLQ